MAIRNVRQHLSEHHSKSASFDLGVGTELDKLRKCFETLETHTDAGDDVKKAFGDAKSSVARLGELFNGHAQYHRDAGKDVEKADAADDLNKLVPTNVSGVTDPSKGPRAVIRPGQPQIQADMPKVDMKFEHLVKIDD